MRTVDERYRTDAEFAQLVDVIYHMIDRLQFTPSETREAAMFAQMKHEMNNPRPVAFSNELQAEIQRRMRP